jgi:exosortase A
MTVQTTAAPLRGQILQNFRLAGPTIGVGLLVIGALFHTEVEAAVRVWIDSTAYNHCFLVIPIVAYLLWDRRELLADAAPSPTVWPGLAAIPVIMLWLLAERLGIMEGRQLMMMTLVEILFLTVLGWGLWIRLAGPLLYLYFLVPFGAFIVPSLQDFTTSFIVHGLNLLNIANYSDGRTIEIPEGTFLVAEACAGLRFLIASFAFGCLYALLVYRSALRRIIFVMISLIVPIIANGFRALGIVVLGHILGSAQAATADHIIYGWLFFSVVILIQIALGLPFREDHRAWSAQKRPVAARGQPARQSAAPAGGSAARGFRRRSIPWHQKIANEVERLWSTWLAAMMAAPSRPVTARRIAQAAAIPVILAAFGPAAAATLNHASGTDLPSTLLPPAFSGACVTNPNAPTERRDGAGRLWVQHLICGSDKFTIQVEVFPTHTSPSQLIAELRQLSGEQGAEVNNVAFLSTPDGPRVWRVVETKDPAGVTASSLWINARPAQVNFDMRMHQAWASVAGARYAPIIVVLSPELDWSKPTRALRDHARDLISLFVQAYRSLPDQVDRLAYAAAR